jgi:RNA polymerase sigma factor for flagellar operon FliA
MQYHSAPDAESRLIVEHAALLNRCVRRVAARAGLWDIMDDLWVAAALALVDALRRYDSSRNVPFAAFAEYRVRGALLDELRRLDHLPRRLRADAEAARRTRDKLRTLLNHEPDAAEVAAELGVPPEQVEQLDALSHPPESLEPEWNGASNHPSPQDNAELGQSKEALAQALNILPERLRTLLALHYLEGMTYREIAAIMEVSEPRICQLHAQALAALRKHMLVKAA